MTPKYPEVTVRVAASGIALLYRVKNALKDAGIDPKEVKTFEEQALAGDYSNLCHVCNEWVTVVQE